MLASKAGGAMAPTHLDVAVLGGGMAGSLLARQLVRQLGGARIGLFERKTGYTHNIGESMVELASNYFVRRLGLGGYLYERHFPKNGLRYFFDSAEKDTPLHEMSEIGSAALPFHPAFQIDRSRLESDLMEMNASAGVQVRRGARVGNLVLGEGGAAHRFTVLDGAGREEFEARWVVDATGRSRMVAKREDLVVPEGTLHNSSVWGWFEGVTDIDSLGPDEFRSRIRYSARRLSTLHFLHRGYWIWFIPLQEGTTSVGVVCDREQYRKEWLGADEFMRFLRSHRGVAQLLEDAKPIAIRGFRHLSYGTKRFFSENRWGLVGEAGAFPDPFYSPGADFIALSNDFVTDLICRDLGGEDARALEMRTKAYDEFMQFRFEAAMGLYRNQYSVLGSFELGKLKWDFDIASYYNLWLSSYMQDQHLSLRFLKRQLRQKPYVLAGLSNFSALFRKIDARLSASDRYHRKNRGVYSGGQELLGFAESVGLPQSDKDMLLRTEEIFNAVWHRGLDLLEGGEGRVERAPRPLAWFLTPRDLAS
jgi:flavin-dependent dehydrogenase